MTRPPIPDSSLALALLGASAVAAAAAWMAASQAWGPSALALGGLALGSIETLRRRRALDSIAARLSRIAQQGSVGQPIEALVGAAETRLAEVETRLLHRHRITGLPTREPLLERMAADARGVVGLVMLRDFERMCAFDDALGERTIAEMVQRAQRMLGRDRFLAQVDRAQLAIWFGPDVPLADARAELDAVAYALGDQIVDVGSGVVISPDVRSASARLPDDGASPDIALRRAIALLASDRAAAVANPVAAARDRYEIEQDLRQAVARGEFEMLFQPLIDPGKARVCGAEALLRWHHPQRGPVSPADFIPLVESSGLADEVGLWALNTAAREARAWQAMGHDRLYVAVNVSGRQLDREDLPALVERTLARHALAPGRLQIELTETVAAGDVARAARLFDTLRAMGVRIAIDDFGTGYSSLAHLRALPFDQIKIDKSFVTSMVESPDSAAIVNAIARLGDSLHLPVTAEGVEDADIQARLIAIGCAKGQGWYYGKPLSIAGARRLLSERGLAGVAAPVATSRRLAG